MKRFKVTEKCPNGHGMIKVKTPYPEQVLKCYPEPEICVVCAQRMDMEVEELED